MIPVPNLDLMKKGLRLVNPESLQTIYFGRVPNLDLMKKGLRLTGGIINV